MAKEILAENSEILLPGWKIERADVFPDDENKATYPFVEIELPSTTPTLCKYEAVELEKGFPGIVADAVITIRGRACAVEIAVTHFVDEEKAIKTEELGLPMFEINLADMIDETERVRIADAVLRYHDNRKWIYNKKQAAALEEKREEFQRKAEKLSRDMIEKEVRSQARREQAENELSNLFEAENYAKAVRRLRNDRDAAAWLEKYDFSAEVDDYPFYMDIPITGEFIFRCDRRIWQGKLFEDYVYNGFGGSLCIFTIHDVQKRIYQRKTIIPIDKAKAVKTTVVIDGTEREISLSFDVLRKYFDYLEKLGFISSCNNEYYSRRPLSMIPPKGEAAKQLSDILASVDPYSPNIDSIIDREMEARSRK